ncbi:MAG: hypothetical protein AAFO81_11245 [Pseudomonadota bacterium]
MTDTDRNRGDNNGDIAQALRALPVVEPDALSVARWQRQALANRNRRAAPRWRLPLTFAATVLVVIAAGQFLPGPGGVSDPAPGHQPAQSAAAQVAAPLPTYVAQTALLEQVLARLPDEGRVRSVERASAIASLEDQLVWLNRAIQNPTAPVTADRHSQLWRERIGVMNTLVTLKQVSNDAVYL